MYSKKNILLLFLVFLFAILLVLPSGKTVSNQTASVVNFSPVPPPEIKAHTVLVKDFTDNEIIFARNEREALPLASLTKIISMLVVLDQVSLDDVIVISKSAMSAEGVSSLKIGERVTVRDLIAMTMTESSNDAVRALVEYTASLFRIDPAIRDIWFLGLMQKKALSLGAPKMVFYDPIGLDVSPSIAGAYGSAEDLLHIAENTFSSPIWSLGSVNLITSRDGVPHMLKPTNKLANSITQLLGAKTGFTEAAGGNLLIITEYPIGHPIGIVVLGSSEEGRFEDMERLLTWITSRVTP